MIEINSKKEFEKEVLNSKETVLVDFWATWCGPCQTMAPIIEEIANDNIVKVCKVDVDKNQDIAEEYEILSIPTLIVFKNGVVSNKQVGVMPLEDIIQLLK